MFWWQESNFAMWKSLTALKHTQHQIHALSTSLSSYALRLSCAYIFRVRYNDQFLLVCSPRNSNLFQPIGGGYRYSRPQALALHHIFGYCPANGKQSDSMAWATAQKLLANNTMAAQSTAFYDCRLLVAAGQALPILQMWFLGDRRDELQSGAISMRPLPADVVNSVYQAANYSKQLQVQVPHLMLGDIARQEGTLVPVLTDKPSRLNLQSQYVERENIWDLRREFNEEVCYSDVLTAAQALEFRQLSYKLRGRYVNAVIDSRYPCGAVYITDVVDLVPNARQEQILSELLDSWTELSHYRFFSEDDIRGRITTRRVPSEGPWLLSTAKAEVVQPLLNKWDKDMTRGKSGSAVKVADHSLQLFFAPEDSMRLDGCLEAKKGELLIQTP